MSGAPARTFARYGLGGGRSAFAELSGGRAHLLCAAPWDGGARTGETLGGTGPEGETAAARLLCPVAPGKIVCVGRNYRAHAQELGNEVPAEPLLFLKPPSALLGPGGAIELPPPAVSDRVEHEAEVGVVIGKRARRVARADALAHVFGFTAAGDITARDLQKKDGQWTRAKGMDTFCPVGPVVAAWPGGDPGPLSIACRVNGELRQQGTTADMIFSVAEVIAYASRFFTLEPGDLLLTGTPSGVGPLRDGDELAITVGGVGTLRCSVAGPP